MGDRSINHSDGHGVSLQEKNYASENGHDWSVLEGFLLHWSAAGDKKESSVIFIEGKITRGYWRSATQGGGWGGGSVGGGKGKVERIYGPMDLIFAYGKEGGLHQKGGGICFQEKTLIHKKQHNGEEIGNISSEKKKRGRLGCQTKRKWWGEKTKSLS